MVSGQLPSKKIVSWFGLGFGLGLELELGLGRGEAGNFPRWQLSHLQVIIHKLYKSKYKSKCSKTKLPGLSDEKLNDSKLCLEDSKSHHTQSIRKISVPKFLCSHA